MVLVCIVSFCCLFVGIRVCRCVRLLCMKLRMFSLCVSSMVVLVFVGRVLLKIWLNVFSGWVFVGIGCCVVFSVVGLVDVVVLVGGW